MKFFDAILLWLVGDGFKSDGEVDLLEKVFDLIDDVSSSVFNK